MSDGVMMIDAELRLVEWNTHFPEFAGIPSDMLRVGMSMEEILRLQAAAGEFGDIDVEAEVTRRMALLRTGGSASTIERRRPNGRVLELRRNPLPEGGFVTLYTDVTVRRQAEEQLRQAQKMEAVGHLTGGVAHDFNNLLMIILGNLEVAERGLKATDLQKISRGIEVARSGARRAASLTQRLLSFSRRQPRAVQSVDPNELITNLTDLVRQSAASNVVVEFVLADQPWMIQVDPNQLEIALLNLVINARDAMPGGGVVTIETVKFARAAMPNAAPLPASGEEFVQITVRDTGHGMPREVAERATEPFFTTKGDGKGTGLGLYQVADFAAQAGGHVRLDSEPGIGTSVTICLPRLVTEKMEEASRSLLADASRFAGRGETILVVENEPDILAYTTEGLEALGYRVLGAQDASSALMLLETTPGIALLFTDLGLPGIDGGQLGHEATRRWPGLPVLYTSGGPEKAPATEGMAGQEGDYIVKPYQLSRLARAIRAVLDAKLPVAARDPA
ncbi:PAS-domain containing protein [Roseomonas xinghualingensis]|uniref:PAS-domain containing protein n=1 Tax=Roseomonas xinghualingensis TaxID=2986475 RepID=UPI0021F12637|nr:PAS-domain containing protein [Roseomonas sp. SXEYE001]MCV4206255.1 PAS-domain containing protein [Roseomonas sp. SXEYE001]